MKRGVGIGDSVGEALREWKRSTGDSPIWSSDGWSGLWSSRKSLSEFTISSSDWLGVNLTRRCMLEVGIWSQLGSRGGQ